MSPDSSSEQVLLREALAEGAGRVVPVDLTPRILHAANRRRRLRRVTVGGGALLVAAATAGVVTLLLPAERSADDVQPAGPATVVLDPSSADELAGARMAIVDAAEGVWVADEAGGQRSLGPADPLASVTGVAVSRDGRWVALGGLTDDALVVLVRDAEGSGDESIVLEPTTQREWLKPFTPAISPDGTTVALATPDASGAVTVQLLRVRGSDESATIPMDGTTWNAIGDRVFVAFSADGTRLLVNCGQDVGSISVAGAFNGQPDVAGPAFVPDPFVLTHGTAASRTLDQILMPRATTDNGFRSWAVLETATGDVVRELSRLAEDVLLGWSDDGSFRWLRTTADPPTSDVVVDDEVVVRISAPNGAGDVLPAWSPGGGS
jgi:hypothetical protein